MHAREKPLASSIGAASPFYERGRKPEGAGIEAFFKHSFHSVSDLTLEGREGGFYYGLGPIGRGFFS